MASVAVTFRGGFKVPRGDATVTGPVASAARSHQDHACAGRGARLHSAERQPATGKGVCELPCCDVACCHTDPVRPSDWAGMHGACRVVSAERDGARPVALVARVHVLM